MTDRPTLYRGDGYLPDAISEFTSTSLRDLLPKIESAANLGIDVELITEYDRPLDISPAGQLRRRYRLRVFPRIDSTDAREMLANIELQHVKRQQAFDELHGPAGGPYADHVK